MLYTTASVCHALYLQSSILSTSSSAYSSLQKKHHQLRYATHHPSTTTSSTLLAFSTIHRQRPITRISNKRCNTILNNAVNNNNEQQQIENDDKNEEHLVGIGVGIDLGTTNSAIAMMIPSTDIDDSEDVDDSRCVHSYIELSHSLTYNMQNSYK